MKKIACFFISFYLSHTIKRPFPQAKPDICCFGLLIKRNETFFGMTSLHLSFFRRGRKYQLDKVRVPFNAWVSYLLLVERSLNL